MVDQTIKPAIPTIDDDSVVEFLQENPDFFVNHPDLLAEINLPHDSGHAVSLIERQVSILRERNMDMRHRLSKLLDNAKDNTALFDKTRRLTLMLLEAQHLKDVIDSVYFSFENDFSISHVGIVLFGDNDLLPETRARVTKVQTARQQVKRLSGLQKTLCGDLPKIELDFVFGSQAEIIQSAAITPLIHGHNFGLLAVGSEDPSHYRSSMGTIFLSYIGEVLSRTVPKFIP